MVNELLTFIQNKIDTLDELSIIQICVTNFSEDEIEYAKTVLYDKCAIDGVRRSYRKGDSKNKNNLKDIIKMFKETDPAEQPAFVAKDLNRLPPVTFDHVDVTRLLKDLTLMKNELLTLRNDTISKTEVLRFQDCMTSELAALRKTIRDDEGSRSSNYVTGSNKIVTTPTQKKRLSRPLPLVNKTAPLGTQLSARSQPVEEVHTPSYRDIIQRNKQTHSKMTSNNIENTNLIDDGFTRVEYKKRKKIGNLTGTGQKPSKLQIADISSSIYVSRLAKSSSIDDVKEHIKDMGETCLDVQLLDQKHDTSFNSYKIIICSSKLERFLNGDFWPEGIKFRRFRERRPSLRQSVLNQNE